MCTLKQQTQSTLGSNIRQKVIGLWQGGLGDPSCSSEWNTHKMYLALSPCLCGPPCVVSGQGWWRGSNHSVRWRRSPDCHSGKWVGLGWPVTDLCLSCVLNLEHVFSEHTQWSTWRKKRWHRSDFTECRAVEMTAAWRGDSWAVKRSLSVGRG